MGWYPKEIEELGAAMKEVMETNPNRAKAIEFRDGTFSSFKTAKDKEDGAVHYYSWLYDEAQKLLKKKEEAKTAASKMVPGKGDPKKPEPVLWEAGSRESSFRDDAVCCCPKCRKARGS